MDLNAIWDFWANLNILKVFYWFFGLKSVSIATKYEKNDWNINSIVKRGAHL